MVLVSPHARQDAEGPNPFVNGGKVRVLPPTVTVLRPEDVAALESSDAAKALTLYKSTHGVQDVLAAMYGLKTRNGRTLKQEQCLMVESVHQECEMLLLSNVVALQLQ